MKTVIAETIQTGIPLIAAGLAASVLPDAGGASLAMFGLTTRAILEPLRPLTSIAICRADASPTARRLFASLASL